MPIQVVCPNPDCGASCSITPEEVGLKVACPACGRRFEAIGETRGSGVDSSLPLDDTVPGGAPPVALPSSFGRYEIIKKLGQGGMGAVYLARDTDLDRLVALKVPNFGAGSDPVVLERFRREARAAAGFHHPNFCPIYEVGQVGGTHYLAMAFVEGDTLRTQVDRDLPMPPREAAEVVRQLALAMVEAHRLGTIHRDLKPANVMVDPRGALIIMDFGLARRSGTDDAELTGTGIAMGTPHYMSPEQVRGDKHDLGPPTDIYALGVILYELMTGRRPFDGPVTMVIGSILHVEPPPPTKYRPDIDARLEAICLKAMAKQVGDRYPSMKALADALGGYLDGASPGGQPPARKWPALLIAVAIALLLGVSGVVAYLAVGPGLPREDPRRKAAASFLARGNARLAAKDFDQAIANYDEAIQLDPNLAPAFSGRGEAWLARKEYRKAIEDCDEAIRLDPKSAPPFANRGAARLGADRANADERVIADYDRAIELDPKSAPAHVGRGDFWIARKDFGKAIAEFDRAIELDPKSARAFNGRGSSWVLREDYDRALADYNRAIELEPKSASAFTNRGRAWYYRKDYDRALADFNSAIELDPKSASAFINRGLVRSDRKDYDRALADDNRAIELDPKIAMSFNNRALVWVEKGQEGKAMADFDEAIRLDPHNEAALRNRTVVLEAKKGP